MSDEFSLIGKYFIQDDHGRLSVPNGDDCAVFRCPPQKEMAVTTDTLVEESISSKAPHPSHSA